MRYGKMIYKRFFLAVLEKLIKWWQVGSNIIMRITLRVTSNRHLTAIRYKYNSWNIIVFIATEGAGSTDPGDPYLYNLPEIFSKLYISPADHPNIIRRYFNSCNVKLQWDNKNTGQFMTSSTNYFQLILVAHLWISLPCHRW